MKNTKPALRILFLPILYLICLFFSSCNNKTEIIWHIGQADDSNAEFALAPDAYNNFIEKDFGWEDRYYLIGYSNIKHDWPYVLPGPSDVWGGTWSTSGWRSHTLNILFGIEKKPGKADYDLIIDLHGH